MCFHCRQSKKAQELINRFNAEIKQRTIFKPQEHINGFTFPVMPVIINNDPNVIDHYNWGLIPNWAKNNDIRRFTLNAKIETLNEKPSFKNSTNLRCLVIVDGFYEWQWLDSKGKNKQKYIITKPNNELFTFGGIWSEWKNPKTKMIERSFSIVTTQANELMSKIHNSKKRMPVILNPDNEKSWLYGDSLSNFNLIDEELIANKVLQE